MSKVAVKKSVLQWALKRSDLTVDNLRHKFPKIPQWIAGEGQPTLRQLESLAKKTKTPLGFFFLNEPPQEQLPIPHFRSIDDEELFQPSPDLVETIHMMQRRQSWMRDFLIDEGQDRLAFVKSAETRLQPTSVADSIRQTLGFNEGWASSQKRWTDALRVLREAMEDIGILVIVNGVVGNNNYRKLDPAEFRGFVLVDEYAPLVFVNGSDGKAAQMFTLAHELAHVFFGSSAAFDLRDMQPADDPMEKACNRVAAEFLVPERELREMWTSIQNKMDPFKDIAREFKVSAIVGARRALDIKLISKDRFLTFYHEYLNAEFKKTKPDGGDFWLTQNLRVGQRFASYVGRAAREGKILYTEAYHLTGLHGKTFDDYVSIVRFGGK